jgi:predicted transcriptional regulator
MVSSMNDKELVLDAIERLPKSATLKQIRERVEFLAAIKEGEESLDRGEGVPQEKVEKMFASWVKKIRSKSSSRKNPVKGII